jgi:hypothetical protein
MLVDWLFPSVEGFWKVRKAWYFRRRDGRGLETGKENLRTDREITVIRFQLPPLYYLQYLHSYSRKGTHHADCGDLIGFPDMRSWVSLATIAYPSAPAE